MRKPDKIFSLVSLTLTGLLVSLVIHRFTYSAFGMTKAEYVSSFNIKLWKQYLAWLPGKIICFVLAAFIIALIIESAILILKDRK